jgi:hypothetical protein
VNSIFIPDFPLTLPLSPDSGGEGGVRGILTALFMQRLGELSKIQYFHPPFFS